MKKVQNVDIDINMANKEIQLFFIKLILQQLIKV